jgi:quinol monooxygenase YgiN
MWVQRNKARRCCLNSNTSKEIQHHKHMTNMRRRDFIVAGGAAIVAAALPAPASAQKEKRMHGLIGKMKVNPGQRDTVVGYLLEGVKSMPGCLSYIVAHDPLDPNAIWITEAWDSKESHRASLSLPAVQQAIARAKPLIAGFGERFETEPVGGNGLPAAAGSS